MAEYVLSHTGAEIDDAAQKRHEHPNQALLDGVTAAKTAEWDAKVPPGRTVNGKPLSEDIVLSAEDVGACRAGLAPEELAALGGMKYGFLQIAASKWQADARAGWYLSPITIPDLSVHERIDLSGNMAMIDALSNAGVRYLMCCNAQGTPYAYAYGTKPSKPVGFHYSTRPVVKGNNSELYGCGISAPEKVTG